MSAQACRTPNRPRQRMGGLRRRGRGRSRRIAQPIRSPPALGPPGPARPTQRRFLLDHGEHRESLRLPRPNHGHELPAERAPRDAANVAGGVGVAHHLGPGRRDRRGGAGQGYEVLLRTSSGIVTMDTSKGSNGRTVVSSLSRAELGSKLLHIVARGKHHVELQALGKRGARGGVGSLQAPQGCAPCAGESPRCRAHGPRLRREAFRLPRVFPAGSRPSQTCRRSNGRRRRLP